MSNCKKFFQLVSFRFVSFRFFSFRWFDAGRPLVRGTSFWEFGLTFQFNCRLGLKKLKSETGLSSSPPLSLKKEIFFLVLAYLVHIHKSVIYYKKKKKTAPKNVHRCPGPPEE